jgi:chemotaxis protein histidine kinase CheA/ActR/RegA family two-component response regulator
MMTDERLRGLVGRFKTQVEEARPRMERAIIELERQSSGSEVLRQTREALARDLHTLKGTAAMLALAVPAQIAHQMEEVLARHRDPQVALPPAVGDALLEALDDFVRRVSAHAEQRQASLDPPERIYSLLETAAKGPLTPEAVPPPIETADAAIPDEETLEAAPNAPLRLLQEEGSWRIDASQVHSLFREMERLREMQRQLEEHARDARLCAEDFRRSGVPAEKMAETRWRLTSLGRQLAKQGKECHDVAEAMEATLKALSTLPLRMVVEPIHRAVRDLCRQAGKEGSLSVVGVEIALDRGLLDTLGRALVHLTRNAVDHGIEPPDERERAGKHREGAIVIRVEHRGNIVVLEVSDDGRGIDVDHLRRVAIERDIVPRGTLDTWSSQQVMGLIFHDGLSTREDVTTTSGRGVGLAAVRREIEALGGHVEVSSKQGDGTRITITVAMSLGTTPTLVVRVGDHTLGIPLGSVESVRAVNDDAVRNGGSRAHVLHQGELIPLLDLGNLLALREPHPGVRGQPLLIIQSMEGRTAVLVDEVLGDKELVLRSLPPELRDLPAVQGAATLTHGEVILLCRPEWLTRSQTTRLETSKAGRRALVVDDSLAARALHRAALEAGGFTVYLAKSGHHALEQLRDRRFDVMVCDIAMAELDGIELTRLLRGRAETRELPIVLVSVHDTEEDKERCVSAGADGFLSKRDCAAGRLLAEVARAMRRAPASRGGAA